MKLNKPQQSKKQLPSNSFWGGQAPMLIAHRGGDGAGSDKENSLAAFAAARQAGYSYGETDVILSKDGQVVAIHGAVNFWDSLLRRRHSRRRLQRLTLEQIRKKFSAGGESIPTLEQILLAQRRMKFFIDPKTEEVTEPLFKLVNRLKAWDRVCIGSFNYHRVKQFQKLAGKRPVHTSFIIGRAFRLINKNLDMLKNGRLKDIEAVQLHHSLNSRQMMDLVHGQGFKAHIWTCNSEIAIKNALKTGADGIISDRITLLKEVINARD